MKKPFFFFIFLLTFLTATAGNESDSTSTETPDSLENHRVIVELGIDEKLIYVNELGLPPNTMVIDALTMFPEMLGRNVQDLLSRYDVQLDDVSVGFNKYNVLAHTMISEVHHIEITTDPSVSQSTSGVGGVIDIITLDVDSGLSGQVSLDLNSDFNIMPTFSLAYKKDKLSVYGSAMMTYYDYKDTKEESTKRTNSNELRWYDNYFKGLTEAFKFAIAYDFNSHDKLTFWVIQNLDKVNDSTSKEINIVEYHDKLMSDSGTYLHGFANINAPCLHSQIDAIVKFERLYDRPSQKLYASLTYSNDYNNDVNKYYYSGLYYTHGASPQTTYTKYVERPNNISTSVYYRFHLLPESSRHTLKLKTGLNYNMGFSKGTDYSQEKEYTVFDDFTQDYTLIPYLTFYHSLSKVQTELSLKYRFKVRRGRGEDSSWQNNFFNDFYGNFNVTYNPVKNHQLRASLSRSMVTPSAIQLYGKQYYKQIENKWYQGDPNLKEPTINSVDLQYLYQYRNKRHEIQLNAAIEYVNAKNLIYETMLYDQDNAKNVVTWANSDQTSRIIDCRLSLFWQTGIFSLNLGGNIYNKIREPINDDKLDNVFYFNLMVQPVLHFEKGWIVSGQCIYNSHKYDGDITEGDAVYMDFNITKAWGPWSARLSFQNTYDYLSTDVEKKGDETVTTSYHLYQCQLKVGFTYVFHKANKR
ncbi:MAG: outer membrane beta-barrel family protein [Paludibacteraceae bacterium]|nr:outer membrane beta-barrel family protein [Paludibacteraceae bacterium]